MTQKFQEKLQLFREIGDEFQIFKGVKFADGVFLSIQGSEGHHSTPQKKLAATEYKTMEVMTEIPEEYLVGWENYGDSVYSNVPVESIQQTIDKLTEVYGEPTY